MIDVIETVPAMDLNPMSCGSHLFILVSFNSSSSPNITHYRVSCSNSLCEEVLLLVNQTRTILLVESSYRGNMIVTAINRCGREASLAKQIPVVTNSCPVVTCPTDGPCPSEWIIATLYVF